MHSRFSQVVLSLSITIFILSAVFLIDIRYIYAAELKDEAEEYRIKGYESQEKGDIDSAISWYQKSASLDIAYAAPHNDLGILFEAKGWLDRAEEEYQKALAIDPDYEKAHTNLALLYERKGELEKAAFHWMKRYKLGKPNDPWAYEAKQRLEKLGLLDKIEGEAVIAPPVEKGAELPEQAEPGGWTRINKDKKEVDIPKKEIKAPVKKKEVRASTEPEKKIKEAPKKEETKPETRQPALKKTSRKAKPKQKEKKSGSEWTKIDFNSGKKTAAKPSGASQAVLDKELQESLKLAEERLKRERGKKDAPLKEQAAAQKAQPKTQKVSSPGARTYYSKAHDYFNKGEYTRALDTIRNAKKDYPEDADLSELEKSVKHKMKEEKIEDHYNAGMMDYRQNDYSGAKKEFEAILNILPE